MYLHGHTPGFKYGRPNSWTRSGCQLSRQPRECLEPSLPGLEPSKSCARRGAFRWGAKSLGLKIVTEERRVPTKSRAVDLRLSSDGVANALVQELPAGVALLSHVDTE